MSQRKTIDIKDLRVSPFTILDKDWMLLTSGDLSRKKFNTMTVAWGGLGTMWQKPLVMVVVRPTRFTYSFMEEYDSFTLTAFPPEFRKQLQYLGSHSGRESDKISEAGLTPEAAQSVPSPAFREADLLIECRKIYFDDFKPANFLADYIQPLYNEDYHRMYFGEVTAVSASKRYI